MKAYQELLRSTSRTFSVGIEALPGRLRDAVTLSYLVLRVSDYYEDSPSLSDEDKRDSLTGWAKLVENGVGGEAGVLKTLEECVSPADRTLPDHQAASQAGFILEGVAGLPPAFQEPIRKHTAATTRGMARWTARGDDFPDEAALDDYMFEVAGRVGLLLTDLFSAHSKGVAERREALLEVAVPFGLGLQTVNVIRGLHEDPDRGWTFVPREFLSAEGEQQKGLHELDEKERHRILAFLVGKAGGHIAEALRYCQILPRRQRGIRIFCVIPALLASKTARVSAGNLRVFQEPVKVERSVVGRTILLSRLLFFSNEWLRWERAQALRLAEVAKGSAFQSPGFS